ncbi:hypothetical protein QYF36_000254 [Acer negundo]|nr:hypothetical protein QYF36_000254 [Acer negundo]
MTLQIATRVSLLDLQPLDGRCEFYNLIRRRRRGAAENGENGGGGNLMIRVARLDLRGSDIAGTTLGGGGR